MKQVKNFVAMGIRVGGGGSKYVEKIGIIGEHGNVVEDMLFSRTKGRSFVIGQVYTGVEFDEGTAYGLARAKWVEKWNNESDIIRWNAEETAAITDYKHRQREKLAGKTNPIDAIMLPLRKEFEAMRRRGDISGCRVLEEAVKQSLQRNVRKDE